MLGVAAATAAMVVALIELGVTLPWGGTVPPGWALPAIAVVGVHSIGSLIEGPIREALGVRRHLDERDVNEILTATLVRLDELDERLVWKQLGIHAFVVRWRVRWTDRPHIRKELVRAGRVRINNNAGGGIHIAWTMNKGFIGECWAKRRDVGGSLHSLRAQHRRMSEEQWNALPPEKRQGLSHSEMESTAGYETVVASPIIEGDTFIGCVSVDAPAGTVSQLRSEEARAVLRDACVVLAKMCKPAHRRGRV